MPIRLRIDSPLPPGSRILISGAPMSFKTTSTLSWPMPNEHVSLPGEKGWETVPLNEPGIRQYYWETTEIESTSPITLIHETKREIFNIISRGLANNGASWTLTLEGLHKMYGWFYKKAYQALEAVSKDGVDFSGRAYGIAHDEYQLFLHEILSTPVPYIVATIWEGASKDDPENTKKGAPSHIFPDLPGQMAKRIVGEFGITLYTEVSKPDLQGRQRGAWTIKPEGKIWGVGVHLPAAIVAKIPSKITPKEWRACHFSDLEPFLRGEVPSGVVMELSPEPVSLPSIRNTPKIPQLKLGGNNDE